LTFVKVAFGHIHQLFGIIAWGVGSISVNMHAKLRCDEELAFVIQMTQTRYAKAFKGIWMEYDWKFALNNMI
jgi:hypothetical protein